MLTIMNYTHNNKKSRKLRPIDNKLIRGIEKLRNMNNKINNKKSKIKTKNTGRRNYTFRTPGCVSTV